MRSQHVCQHRVTSPTYFLIAQNDDSSPDSNTGSELDSDSDSDSDFAELLKIAVSQKKKIQKQQNQQKEQQKKEQHKQKQQQQNQNEQHKQKQQQQQNQKEQQKQQQKQNLSKHRVRKNERREPKIIKRDRDDTKSNPDRQQSKKRRIAVVHKPSQSRGQIQSYTKTLPPSPKGKKMEMIKPLPPTCSLLERLNLKSPAKQEQSTRSGPTTATTNKKTCQFVTERMQVDWFWKTCIESFLRVF